jgi:hypothetical protein
MCLSPSYAAFPIAADSPVKKARVMQQPANRQTCKIARRATDLIRDTLKLGIARRLKRYFESNLVRSHAANVAAFRRHCNALRFSAGKHQRDAKNCQKNWPGSGRASWLGMISRMQDDAGKLCTGSDVLPRATASSSTAIQYIRALTLKKSSAGRV